MFFGQSEYARFRVMILPFLFILVSKQVIQGYKGVMGWIFNLSVRVGSLISEGGSFLGYCLF